MAAAEQDLVDFTDVDDSIFLAVVGKPLEFVMNTKAGGVKLVMLEVDVRAGRSRQRVQKADKFFPKPIDINIKLIVYTGLIRSSYSGEVSVKKNSSFYFVIVSKVFGTGKG